LHEAGAYRGGLSHSLLLMLLQLMILSKFHSIHVSTAPIIRKSSRRHCMGENSEQLLYTRRIFKVPLAYVEYGTGDGREFQTLKSATPSVGCACKLHYNYIRISSSRHHQSPSHKPSKMWHATGFQFVSGWSSTQQLPAGRAPRSAHVVTCMAKLCFCCFCQTLSPAVVCSTSSKTPFWST